MKKIWATLLMAFASLIAIVSLAACADYSEIAGTYEMTEMSGTLNNVTMKKDSYEYFRLILTKDGKGTVESKLKGSSAVEYKATGTFTYSAEDGKIRLTVKSDGASATEEYQYADGVITYNVVSGSNKYTVKFARSEG